MRQMYELGKSLLVVMITSIAGLAVLLALIAYYCITIYFCLSQPGSFLASAMITVAVLSVSKVYDFMSWFDGFNQKKVGGYMRARQEFEKSLVN